MKSTWFLIAEAVVILLLGCLTFVSLLFQPTWMWIAVPVLLIAAFVGISKFAKTNVVLARVLVFVSPLVLIVYLLYLMIAAGSQDLGVIGVALGYYTIGALLMALHLWLNSRKGRSEQEVTAI